MKTLSAALLAAMLVLASCGDGREQAVTDRGDDEASAALAALLDEHFERNLELNPLSATSIGDYRYNDRLAISIGTEHRWAVRELNQEILRRLAEIDRDHLSDQDQLSYDMFKLLREQSLERQQFPSHLQPFSQYYMYTSNFARLGSGSGLHPFKTVKDYDDFLSRIDDFVTYVDQAMENMKEGVVQGIVQPRVLMLKALPQLDSLITDDPGDSGFFTPIRNMPQGFSDDDRTRLTIAYKDAIANKIMPAFARLKNFIGDDYLGAARETFGLLDLPNGEAWYAFLVRVRTTTDLTPGEIHQIGLDEVARIHGEMRGVMEEVGFEGDLKEFFEFLNTDEQFFFDEPEQLIQGYRDMSDHIAGLATGLFDVFPKASFEVRRVEEFREQSSAGASYQAGTPDGSRAGIFYVNAYDIKARPKWAMESLFLHEAIPGHHFQISVQQENDALPRFRRFARFTAYSEGWGLYAESLGTELGIYTDPYQHFGGLNAELWRAIRLVVDTGIHARGWSRQQVLDYMYANSAVAEARAVAEAERYMARPGQALAYKIGQLKIREIRDHAEERLGERFDVRVFHTEILKDGPMPLAMLEEKLDRWVQAQL
ncbi:MAG: DUF885 domain-containing protein [Proteobacteria bacterium]|nr:DUF885 domain-containing protein [Pseudomonadota bacterium]